MKETLKKLSAGLLTLTVIVGVGGLLTMSLANAQPRQAVQQTAAQTTIETVVVYGHRPANHASSISQKRQKEAANNSYVAAQHHGMKEITYR